MTPILRAALGGLLVAALSLAAGLAPAQPATTAPGLAPGGPASNAELDAMARRVASGHPEAMEGILKRAEAGEAHAQLTAGLVLLRGKGVPRSEMQAVVWFRRAAEQGNLSAMHNLAVVLDRGPPGVIDRPEALKWYRAAAEKGYARSQSNLAYLIVQEGGVERLPEARAWLEKAAAQDEPLAHYMLGTLLYEGRGVSKDEAEGARLIQRGAQGGEREAQYRLALILGNGRGLERDEKSALQWLRRSAEQGYPEAQLLLGAMFMRGRPDLPRDTKAGITWLRRAARQENAEAQYALGLAYAEGRGVAQDMHEAVAWISAAAKNGHERAIEDLARARQSGRMAPQPARPASPVLGPSPWSASPPRSRPAPMVPETDAPAPVAPAQGSAN